MLLLDGYESHLSMPVVNYAEKEKILLVCLPSHATHLLQPLDVGLFGPLQHYYALEVDRLAQLGVSLISKCRFLQILAPARLKAYTTKNVASAWEKAGIEPYNPSPVLDRIPGARSTTPDPSPPAPTVLRTPRTAVQVDRVLDNILGKERSPTLLRGIEKLSKSVKRAFAEIELQAAREKDLLEVNARRKTRKTKLSTKKGLFLTPDRANQLRRERNERDTMEARRVRLRQAREERLAALQKQGMLPGRKRCPKGRLVILFGAFPGMGEESDSKCSSEASTDVEEA